MDTTQQRHMANAMLRAHTNGDASTMTAGQMRNYLYLGQDVQRYALYIGDVTCDLLEESCGDVCEPMVQNTQ